MDSGVRTVEVEGVEVNLEAEGELNMEGRGMPLRLAVSGGEELKLQDAGGAVTGLFAQEAGSCIEKTSGRSGSAIMMMMLALPKDERGCQRNGANGGGMHDDLICRSSGMQAAL